MRIVYYVAVHSDYGPEPGGLIPIRPGGILGGQARQRQLDGRRFGSLVCLVLALISPQVQTKTSSSTEEAGPQSSMIAPGITSIGRCIIHYPPVPGLWPEEIHQLDHHSFHLGLLCY